MKHALFLVKSPPYGTLRVTEGYRAALGTAATGISTGVVLVGDGVYAALKNQDSSGIDQPCVAELMETLGDLGVEVFLLGPSIEERRLLRDGLLPFPVLSAEELKTRIDESHAVFVF